MFPIYQKPVYTIEVNVHVIPPRSSGSLQEMEPDSRILSSETESPEYEKNINQNFFFDK